MNYFKKKVNYLLVDNLKLLKSHLNDPISDKSLLTDYNSFHQQKVVEQIRLAHIFLSLLFIFFAVYDSFIITDPEVKWLINLVRFLIVLFIFIPFYIITLKKELAHYLQPLLVVVYLFYGGFVLFVFYLIPDSTVIDYRQFISLLILIICLFVLIGMKKNNAFVVSVFYLVVFNFIFFVNTQGFSFSELNSLKPINFIEFNTWFIIVITGGYLLAGFSENVDKKNYLYNRLLLEQKGELKKSNEVKNTFLSIITHDFKNLAALQYSTSEYLISRYDALVDDKRKELINLINTSAIQTINLLDQMVEWVKAQTSRIDINGGYIDLKRTIDDIVNLLQPTILKKQINIISNIEEGATYFVDQNSINTILRNIIGNAIKYSAIGGEIQIKGFTSENKSVIQIIDFGIGMSVETNALILTDNINTSIGGTDGERGNGLGLVLCKELVKLNQGELLIKSELEKGTVVTISFPVNNLK